MLPIKHYGFLLAIAVVGVVLFGFNTIQAEELYSDGYPSTFATSTDKCIAVKNGTEDLQTCDSVFTTGARNRFLQQELYIPVSDWGTIAISKIVVKQQSITPSGSGDTGLELVLLNENNTGVATTTESFAIGGQEKDLTFTFDTPYAVTASTQVHGFRLHTQSGNADPGALLRVSQNFWPNNLGFTNSFDLKRGTYGDFSNSTEYDGYDLWTRIYTDEAVHLEITYPENNATVNAIPQPISGTCTNDFELSVYQGISIASSTTLFGESIICPGSETWTRALNLEYGFWNVFASSTVDMQTDGIVFFYSAQSVEPIPTFDNNPFAPEEGGDLGFWGYLYDWGINKGTLRPYSYIPQIGTAMYTALASPTSTDWLTAIPINYGSGTAYLPAIDSGLFDDIPTDYKTNLRTISTIAFSASFIVYVWHLRKRFNG